MNSLTLKSPAKLNLHLRILGKRPDGYHDLLTVFHRISLCDTMRIQKIRSGFRLKTDKTGLETGEGNLITKAFRLMQKKFPELDGVSVRLNKRIPLGAGLGGGSSNAAHFLLGMRKIFNLKISGKELVRIGKKLGADVPFFLFETTQAMAWGIGEKIKKLPSGKKIWFLLLVTEQGLNTKKVYQNLDKEAGILFQRKTFRPLPAAFLTKEKGIARILRSFLDTGKIREAARLARNDLEPSAFNLRPSIPKAINILKTSGAPFVLMSGSGPTVFTVFSSRRQAVKAGKKLRTGLARYRKVLCSSF